MTDQGSGYSYKDIVIPDFAMERIRYLSQRTGIQLEQLLEEYYKIFKDPWVQQDPQFKNDYERHSYSIRKLWVTILSRPPTKEVTVIPFGVSEARTTRTGKIQSRIYVLVKRDQGWEKSVIICQDRTAGLWEEVQLFYAYKIRVFDNGKALFAVPETKFENPLQPIPSDPITFLEKVVGVKRFRLAEVHKNISRTVEVGGKKMIDEFDIKSLDGIVLYYRVGQRPDGSRFGLYVVSDDSVGTEDSLDEEGRIVPSQFTVWVPPVFVKYDIDSEIYVYGQVRLDKEGRPFMNAIGVIPIHVKHIPSR